MMAGMIPLILTGLLRVLRTRRALVLENLALRHQLAVLQRTAPRPRLRTSDRLLWVLLSRIWSGWTDAVSVVQPATVIRWQRTGFKLVWTWKSRRNGPGRPAVALEVRALIRRMSKANPIWSAPRIHGELQKLGIEISQAAVSKYLGRRTKPPSQTWRSFLDNHVRSLVSVDFFIVPTVTFKVLFVYVVLAHDRRRAVHINVTDTPTAQWTAQQLVEAFPWEIAPRYLLRDRDAVYGVVFSSRAQTLGIDEVKTAPRPLAESVRGAPHWDPAPRVPRPRRGGERSPSPPPAARVPRLLPPLPDSPFLGEGHTGAETGGAPRPGWNRPDAHGRRPASSVHAAGCVRSTGIAPDLMEATRAATRAMLDHLVRSYGLSRQEAYVLCSVAVDLKISEVVDAPNWIVSAYLPLVLFR
jgi:putative transposase